MFCAAIVALLLVNLASSFNIAINGQFNTVQPPIATKRESSFFGYDLLVRNNNRGQFSVVAGSPKYNGSSRDRFIFLCPIQLQLSLLNRCLSVPVPRGVSSSSGLNFVIGNGRIAICLPSQVLDCIDVQISPGICYQSNNNGRSWTKISSTEDENCPISTESTTLDLIFLLDGSASVGAENFLLVKEWVKSIATNFDIQSGLTQIGIVEYASYDFSKPITNQIHLNTVVKLGSSRSHLIFNNSVDNIPYYSGDTYTGKGLNKSLLEFQTSNRYNLSNNRKVLVLLTDGRAADFAQLLVTGNNIRDLGIRILAVGVGNTLTNQLRVIASGNSSSDEGVFSVENFNALDSIANQLRNAIGQFSLEDQGNDESLSRQRYLAEKGFSIVQGNRKMPKTSVKSKLSLHHQLHGFSVQSLDFTSLSNEWKDINQVMARGKCLYVNHERTIVAMMLIIFFICGKLPLDSQ